MATMVSIKEELSNLSPDKRLIIQIGSDGTFEFWKENRPPEKKGIGATMGGKKKACKVKDTETGIEYKSKVACGYALLDLVSDKVKKGQENWAWYALVKKYPGRFIELTEGG